MRVFCLINRQPTGGVLPKMFTNFVRDINSVPYLISSCMDILASAVTLIGGKNPPKKLNHLRICDWLTMATTSSYEEAKFWVRRRFLKSFHDFRKFAMEISDGKIWRENCSNVNGGLWRNFYDIVTENRSIREKDAYLVNSSLNGT